MIVFWRSGARRHSHFIYYVCESVTQGVTLLNSSGDACGDIIDLLTVDNEQQALDCIGGPGGAY